MKKLLVLAALGAFAISAHAASFQFKTGNGEFELDHYYAYSWGVNGTNNLRTSLISGGQQIQSAKLTIWNVWDWTVESNDILYIHLLDDTKSSKYWDNQGGGDYFASKGGLLTTWSDPKGGNTSNKSFDFIYNFSVANINLLTSYLVDPTSSNKAAFGLGFDPDCHYFNGGIQLDIVTCPKKVPEGALTISLLGLSFISLAGIRRFVRR